MSCNEQYLSVSLTLHLLPCSEEFAPEYPVDPTCFALFQDFVSLVNVSGSIYSIHLQNLTNSTVECTVGRSRLGHLRDVGYYKYLSGHLKGVEGVGIRITLIN